MKSDFGVRAELTHASQDLSALKIPIVLDHDIGTNPDDFYAFDYLLSKPQVELLFVVSGNRHPLERAQLARRVLDLYSRADVPSYVGEDDGCVDFFCQQHIKGNEVTQNDYLRAIREALEVHPKIVYICIQGLSNAEKILKRYPDLNERILFYHMGLSTDSYESVTDGGTNMRADQLAARYVYENAKFIRAVGLQTTLKDSLRVTPGTEIYERLMSSETPLGRILKSHTEEFLSRRGVFPAMHDAVTVSAALEEGFVRFEEAIVNFLVDGRYQAGWSTPVIVSNRSINSGDFMSKLTDSIEDNGAV